jgi:hypothetical protein
LARHPLLRARSRAQGRAKPCHREEFLGRPRLSGLATGTKSPDRGQLNFDRRILDEPVIPGVTLQPKTVSGWTKPASRQPPFRHDFTNPEEPTQAAFSMTGDVSLTDANRRPYPLYVYDTPLRAADGQSLAAGQIASGSLHQSVAQIFAWPDFFLPDRERRDRLVLTYG